MLSGEIVPIIEVIDFNSKSELLTKLRSMRDATIKLCPEDRQVVKQMLGVGIQQVYYASEKELLRYRDFVRNGKKKEMCYV